MLNTTNTPSCSTPLGMTSLDSKNGAKMLLDTRYFNRTEPTLQLMGCSCGNFGDDGADDACPAGMGCKLGFDKMEPIEDEI